MIIFLTSSHTLGWAGDLNPANGLVAGLRATLHHPIRCVMVSSYPDDIEITDRMAWEIRECFERADLAFADYKVIDRRTQNYASQILREANFIILCGGHVPTENKFFQELHLKQLLQEFDGTMLTISAGSMNCADTVYAPPEYDGEVDNPTYVTYFRGLELTNINIVPHFQQLRKVRLGGRKLIHDIVAKDSFSHPVYCLPDGSFFLIMPDRTELRGEAYRMSRGRLTRICNYGERRRLSPKGRSYKI